MKKVYDIIVCEYAGFTAVPRYTGFSFNDKQVAEDFIEKYCSRPHVTFKAVERNADKIVYGSNEEMIEDYPQLEVYRLMREKEKILEGVRMPDGIRPVRLPGKGHTQYYLSPANIKKILNKVEIELKYMSDEELEGFKNEDKLTFLIDDEKRNKVLSVELSYKQYEILKNLHEETKIRLDKIEERIKVFQAKCEAQQAEESEDEEESEI